MLTSTLTRIERLLDEHGAHLTPQQRQYALSLALLGVLASSLQMTPGQLLTLLRPVLEVQR